MGIPGAPAQAAVGIPGAPAQEPVSAPPGSPAAVAAAATPITLGGHVSLCVTVLVGPAAPVASQPPGS